jgi:hypothetical protein
MVFFLRLLTDTSETPTGLQAMMDAAGAYANEHLFAFGREKTNVIVFGSSGRLRHSQGKKRGIRED